MGQYCLQLGALTRRSILKKDTDAYGHELWDYYKGSKFSAHEIIERSDGFIDPSDVAPKLYFAPFKEWTGIERRAIRHARGRVLDVGCGAGRVAIYLQNTKKLDTLGIDISPLAIRVSRSRGLKKARLIAFQDIDFRPASFDTVIMFGNNFGLFASMKTARVLMRKLFRIQYFHQEMI